MKFVSYLPAAAVSTDCSWRRACLPPRPTPRSCQRRARRYTR